MNVWTNEGLDLKTILPIFEHKHEYLKFGKEHHILASLKQGPQNWDPIPDCEGDKGDKVNDDEIIKMCCSNISVYKNWCLWEILINFLLWTVKII